MIYKIFTELEILSMLKDGDKLSMRNGIMTIEKKTHPIKTAVRRWINNDNRHSTLMEIDNIISDAMKMYREHRIDNDDITNLCSIDDTSNIWITQQFCEQFRNCIEGLQNLKKTYNDDSAVVAKLNIICKILDEECRKMSLVYSK